MRQSRLMSFVEAGANVVVGFVLAVAVQLLLFPVLGLQPTLPQSLGIALVFTALSLLRSYALRRVFARLRFVRGDGR